MSSDPALATRLFVWAYKEEGTGAQVLIGADPADPSTIFMWPVRPHGWEDRKPWTGGALVEPLVKAVPTSVGESSGWPGTPRRSVGRPRKQAEPGAAARPVKERLTTLTLSITPGAYARLMGAAGAREQTYGDWVVDVLREPVPPVHEVVETHKAERAGGTGHVIVRIRAPQDAMIKHQRSAGDAGMLLNMWLSAVVMRAVRNTPEESARADG
jgi:hypothetical protein